MKSRAGKFSTIWITVAVLLTALVVGGAVYYLQESKTIKITSHNPNDFLPVYGSDKELMNEEINYYIEVPPNLPLIEKLDIIADSLSRFNFNSLPIEVLRIEERKGKRIAVIYLREHEWNRDIDWSNPKFMSGNQGVTWRARHFQGSTGGSITSFTLTETFLQRGYERDWIDGVIFMYENEPIKEDEWAHISLSGVIYR